MSTEGPSAKKSKKDHEISDEDESLPECPYGERCYRKNPLHFEEYYHPKKGDTKKRKTATKIDTDSLPPCPFGASCYRKNLLHFAEYSHPTSTTAGTETGSGDDTDVYASDDQESDKTDKVLHRSLHDYV